MDKMLILYVTMLKALYNENVYSLCYVREFRGNKMKWNIKERKERGRDGMKEELLFSYLDV